MRGRKSLKSRKSTTEEKAANGIEISKANGNKRDEGVPVRPSSSLQTSLGVLLPHQHRRFPTPNYHQMSRKLPSENALQRVNAPQGVRRRCFRRVDAGEEVGNELGGAKRREANEGNGGIGAGGFRVRTKVGGPHCVRWQRSEKVEGEAGKCLDVPD